MNISIQSSVHGSLNYEASKLHLKAKLARNYM